MTAQHGVMIGLAIWSMLGTFGMFLLSRKLRRDDNLEKKVAECVPRAELQTMLQGISDEGIAREDRLTRAIATNGLTISNAVTDLRTEIRSDRNEMRGELANHQRRIDEVMRLQQGGGYRRS